ncbi:hypothetical protein ACHQM5_008746 [Ranunculus cassubicifolius]
MKVILATLRISAKEDFACVPCRKRLSSVPCVPVHKMEDTDYNWEVFWEDNRKKPRGYSSKGIERWDSYWAEAAAIKDKRVLYCGGCPLTPLSMS